MYLMHVFRPSYKFIRRAVVPPMWAVRCIREGLTRMRQFFQGVAAMLWFDSTLVVQFGIFLCSCI